VYLNYKVSFFNLRVNVKKNYCFVKKDTIMIRNMCKYDTELNINNKSNHQNSILGLNLSNENFFPNDVLCLI
jgi:hypothetical protein